MQQECIAVRGEYERDVERDRVVERLLHAVADGVGVVLRLDQRQRDVRLDVEDIVGALGLAAGHELAADDDPPLSGASAKSG